LGSSPGEAWGKHAVTYGQVGLSREFADDQASVKAVRSSGHPNIETKQ
jgi:hypothetical protein